MTDLAPANARGLNVLDHIHFEGAPTPARRRRSASDRADLLRPVLASSPPGHASQPPPKPKADPFVAWLFDQCGMAVDSYRPIPLQRRLPACLRVLRVSSPDAARALLEKSPALMPLAINTMLLGVSSFFRDETVFDFIERRVIPDLLQNPTLRVLSVGVSDGHELYSIAMLLAEAGALRRSELLGVDCRADAVQRTRAGVFAEGEVAALTARRRAHFFVREKTACRASVELRSAIRAEVANLFCFAPPPSDLILFRNVAIYLEDEALARVWRNLADSLAPGGYLITGKAEKCPQFLPLARVSTSVYQKIGAQK